MRRPVEMLALWWDGKAPHVCYNANETKFLVLLADFVSVDDDFLAKMKTSYSSCSYSRMKRHDGKVMD
jgi:hypothetical protein